MLKYWNIETKQGFRRCFIKSGQSMRNMETKIEPEEPGPTFASNAFKPHYKEPLRPLRVELPVGATTQPPNPPPPKLQVLLKTEQNKDEPFQFQGP